MTILTSGTSPSAPSSTPMETTTSAETAKLRGASSTSAILRNPSLENYRRVEKPRQLGPENEVRILASGRVGKYVTYATKLLQDKNKELRLSATGKAVSVAVVVCELLKRRIEGLHQLTEIGWIEMTDEYQPLKEGLPVRFEKHTLSTLSIRLSRDPSAMDTTAPGYQLPLTPEEFAAGSWQASRKKSTTRSNKKTESNIPVESSNSPAPDAPRSQRTRRRRPRRNKGVKTSEVEKGKSEVTPTSSPSSHVSPLSSTSTSIPHDHASPTPA